MENPDIMEKGKYKGAFVFFNAPFFCNLNLIKGD